MKEIPYEIALAIKGLDNNNRQQILLSLYKTEPLSFSDIQKQIQIEKSLLANHLKNLVKNLLVEHYYKHDLGTEYFSYYSITAFGETLLDNLFSALIPKQIQFTQKVCTAFKSQTANNVGDDLKANIKNELKSASSGDIEIQTVNVVKQV